MNCLKYFQAISARTSPLRHDDSKSLIVRAYSIYGLGFVGKGSDIPMIEASLVEAKKMSATNPEDREALGLIDGTTSVTLEQVRRKPGQKNDRR